MNFDHHLKICTECRTTPRLCDEGALYKRRENRKSRKPFRPGLLMKPMSGGGGFIPVPLYDRGFF